MTPVASGDADRRRRRATVEVKQGLRELGAELTLLNRRVGARLGLKDVDLDCLDLINAHGPLSPTALARRAGLHAATTTGFSTGSNVPAGWLATATRRIVAPSWSEPCATATPNCWSSSPG